MWAKKKSGDACLKKYSLLDLAWYSLLRIVSHRAVCSSHDLFSSIVESAMAGVLFFNDCMNHEENSMANHTLLQADTERAQ
jgi:hypothetical protein